MIHYIFSSESLRVANSLHPGRDYIRLPPSPIFWPEGIFHRAGILYAPHFYTPSTPRRVFSRVGVYKIWPCTTHSKFTKYTVFSMSGSLGQAPLKVCLKAMWPKVRGRFDFSGAPNRSGVWGMGFFGVASSRLFFSQIFGRENQIHWRVSTSHPRKRAKLTLNRRWIDANRR